MIDVEIDVEIDTDGRRARGPGRDHRSRVRLAARHAQDLYPGPLGRLVAHELTAYADDGRAAGGLAELVVREVLGRPAPRARRHVRSGEIDGGGRAAR